MLIVSGDNNAISDIEQVVSICMPETVIKTTDEMSQISSLIKSMHPEIIILDLNGRNLDGFKALKETRQLTSVPIITMSYVRDSSLLVQALEGEADLHITKPIGQMEFVAHVRACLRRSQSKFEHLPKCK